VVGDLATEQLTDVAVVQRFGRAIREAAAVEQLERA